jgi:inner membrane protein
LFISLTFIAFAVFEITRKQPIHPVQYLLVGLALAVFYLLLIAASEHIAFHWAYLLAASACTGLLGYYLTGVLRSFKAGLYFSALVAGLYATLFVIINSEDAALLMGSVLLFLALSVLMVVTRRLDWYSLGAVRESGVKAG